MKQINLIPKTKLEYGGTLLKTRKFRTYARPIDTKNTMHLILKSSKAKGDYSFKKQVHDQFIRKTLREFTHKYGIKILSFANSGNHLHIHIKITNRNTYKPFIRAITASIAMKITGASRWSKSVFDGKFWDYRPFTRVVIGFSGFLKVQDYIKINQLESVGHTRTEARFIIASRRQPRLFLI